MEEMKVKEFSAKWKAQKFIEEMGKGIWEGPFMDENMNVKYFVFWKEEVEEDVRL